MIWGTPTDVKTSAAQAELRRKANGIRRFAWFPVKIHTGEWCWLQPIWTYHRVNEYSDGTLVPVYTDSEGGQWIHWHATKYSSKLSGLRNHK